MAAEASASAASAVSTAADAADADARADMLSKLQEPKLANLNWEFLKHVAKGPDVPQDRKELAIDYVDLVAERYGAEPNLNKDELANGWHSVLHNAFKEGRSGNSARSEITAKLRTNKADRLNKYAERSKTQQRKVPTQSPKKRKQSPPTSPTGVADDTEHVTLDQVQQAFQLFAVQTSEKFGAQDEKLSEILLHVSAIRQMVQSLRQLQPAQAVTDDEGNDGSSGGGNGNANGGSGPEHMDEDGTGSSPGGQNGNTNQDELSSLSDQELPDETWIDANFNVPVDHRGQPEGVEQAMGREAAVPGSASGSLPGPLAAPDDQSTGTPPGRPNKVEDDSGTGLDLDGQNKDETKKKPPTRGTPGKKPAGAGGADGSGGGSGSAHDLQVEALGSAFAQKMSLNSPPSAEAPGQTAEDAGKTQATQQAMGREAAAPDDQSTGSSERPKRWPFRTENNAERIAKVRQLKDEGTEQFKRKDWAPARLNFLAATILVEALVSDASVGEEAAALLVACSGNAAQCSINLSDYEAAIARCTQVLEVDGNNIKALYRRGKARSRLGWLDEAEGDLRAALGLDWNNEDVQAELAKVMEAKDKAPTGGTSGKMRAAGGAAGADGSGEGSGGAHAVQAEAPGSAFAQKMSLINSPPNAEAPGQAAKDAGKAQATQQENFSDDDIIDAAWQGDLARVAELLRRGAKANTTSKNGWTPLHLAAQNGHTEMVRLLLANCADVDAPGKRGSTPLFLAAQLGHTEVVGLLLANGANVGVSLQDGSTLLYMAAQEGHTEVVGLLLANGANANTPQKNGATPLFTAAQNGHTEVVVLLLANGANVNASKQNGATPLFIAAQNGHTEVVGLLLANGANANTPNENEATPLFIAAQNGHTHVARLLLANGAHVNAPARDGSTPLYIAAQNGHTEVVVLLLENGANVNAPLQNGQTPLYIAAQKKYTEVARLLLANGANANAPNQYGATPLYMAAQFGQTEVVGLLLANGANANAPQKNGATPLYIAAQEGHTEVVRLLLANRANVNAPEKNGATPLHIAAYFGHMEVAGLLLVNGAHVNVTGKDGFTPLYIAAQNGQTEVAGLLLANGADVNGPKKDGSTPLHIAAQNGQTEVAGLLLANGADVNAPKQNGWTPLHLATQNGQKEVMGLLLANGANANAPNKDGKTPRHIAAQFGHTEVAGLLLANRANVNAPMQVQDDFVDACARRDLEAMQRLQEKGAEWTGQDSEGRTPLDVCQGWLNAEGLMHLHAGVGVNQVDKTHGRTQTLPAAASDPDADVAWLVESLRHADLNSGDNAGKALPTVAAQQDVATAQNEAAASAEHGAQPGEDQPQ